MFPADNEAEMDARTEADRQATFDTDYEFGHCPASSSSPATITARLWRPQRCSSGVHPVVEIRPVAEF
jgi:hypothetical protein